MRLFFSVIIIALFFSATTSFRSAKSSAEDYYIVITKSRYEMTLYDANNIWLVTYPVVFGSKDLGDKMMAGDRKTPEGTYHIINKRPHPKWDHFLSLDYPTQEDYQKFNERKAEGAIPQTAKIGGAIGIHGTWPHEDFAIDQYQNWTEGCISTKNEYIQELFQKVPVGTKVIIKR